MSLLDIFDPSPSSPPAPANVEPEPAGANGTQVQGPAAPGPVEKFTESTAKTLGLEVPAPRGRGRPKGSKNAAVHAPDTAAPSEDAAPPPAPGFDLYINALPLPGGQFQNGDDYVRGLCAQLEKAFGCPEIRIPPSDAVMAQKYDAAMGFGKWKGSLQALARRQPPTGAIVIFTGDDVTQVVIEALRPLATGGALGVG